MAIEYPKIVIMAAGHGKRLMPYTKDNPKCLVKINEKPIIQYIYDSLKKINTFELIIIHGYQGNKIKEYCKNNFNMKCTFIEQEKINGTSNAIFLTKDYVGDNFIVLSGDIIYSEQEIRMLLSKKNSLLYTQQDNRLFEYGTLVIKDNLIKHITEKSYNPVSKYINCGAYHFTKEIFEYIAETEYDDRFKEKIITNTINLMIEDGIDFYGIKIPYLNEITYIEDINIVGNRLKGYI